MKRLYVIHALVEEEADLSSDPIALRGYVSAECPYEALFMLQYHLKEKMEIDFFLEPMIELVDHENFDRVEHSERDVNEAMLFNLVVVNQEIMPGKEELLACA